MAEHLHSSPVECSHGMYGMQEATGLIPNWKKINNKRRGKVCERITPHQGRHLTAVSLVSHR